MENQNLYKSQVFVGDPFSVLCLPIIRRRKAESWRMMRNYLECIYYDPSWSSYKPMWNRSLKDYSFVKSCKSITRCIHWYKENEKVTYPSCKYSSMDWCPYRTINKWFKIRLKLGRLVGSNYVTLRKRRT